MHAKYYNNSNFNRIINTFRHSLKLRFVAFDKEKVFRLAAILDPRFKDAWCKEDELSALHKLIKDEMSRMTSNNSQPVMDTSTDADVPVKRCKLFSYMGCRSSNSACTSRGSTIDEELSKYLADPCLSDDSDPLKFWKIHEASMPTLAKLAILYLPVPATSSPVERLFSVGGRVFKPDRCRLTDKRFETLMFIKCNKGI